MIWLRLFHAAALTLALAACVSLPASQGPSPQAPTPPPVRSPAVRPALPHTAPAPPVAGFIMPEIMNERGLDGIIREGRAGLLNRFGAARLDVLEGDMRKLQFSGEACILDIYLYPLAPGASPVATWVEARRRSDGAAVDRAACVAALSRR